MPLPRYAAAVYKATVTYAVYFQNHCRSKFLDLNQQIYWVNLGWFTHDGYRYKVTLERNWHASRNICRSWEADLAVHGVQTLESRM